MHFAKGLRVLLATELELRESAMGLTIVEVVIGAIFAILVTIWSEKLRKPELELRIAPLWDMDHEEPHPAKQMRALGLKLVNRPLPRWARWMSRNAALQCHGFITFHHLDGQNVFGRAMSIRWSGSPEPVAIHVVVDDKRFTIADPARITLTSRRDVYPGESERLDVVARFDNEDECYGWNNDSYFSNPPWRNPDWSLSPDRYIVKVTVVSAGEKCTGIFRLINDVAQRDFRLEPALPDDAVHISSAT